MRKIIYRLCIHFSFDLSEGYCEYQRTDYDTENVGQYDIKHIMVLQIKTTMPVLKVQHTLSQVSQLVQSDNVCLNFHYCCYSIYTVYIFL